MSTHAWRRLCYTLRVFGHRSIRRLGVVLLATALVALQPPLPVAATSPAAAVLRTGLPNHTLMPGAWNLVVTPGDDPLDDLRVRLDQDGPAADVLHQPAQGRPDQDLRLPRQAVGDYEEDHLISLELGGSPKSTKNLWREPHHVVVGGLDLGSYNKDSFETHLKSLVCAGKLAHNKARPGRQVERWISPDDAAAWDAIFNG